MTLLPFEWDDDSAGPKSERLSAALRHAVTSGRLAPGERLPPTRQLAADLGVSRWVVTDAYEQLGAEGYLRAQSGAGTYVAEVPRSRADPPRAPTTTPAGGHDLRPNVPDLTSFPATAWRAATTRALRSLGASEMGYPDPHGDPALRRVLSDYLRRVRGLDADPGDLLITSGTSHSLSILFRAIARSGGGRVAVEDPGWPRAPEAARAAGLEVVPVPVDGDGLVVDRLTSADVDVTCITPSHQYPTGVPLSPPRRQALLEWATGDRLLVEDDYDAEFRYDRRPLTALAGLGGARVIYLGSTSKTIGPALRIGWLIVSGWVRRPVLEVLATDAAGPSTLDQRALAELIASGVYDTHLRRMRRTYRARRASFLAALREELPDAHVTGLDAGVHCCLWLNVDDDSAVAGQLAARGILTTSLSECRHEQSPAGGLLVGYANLAPHRAAEVCRAVAAASAPGAIDA